MSDQESAARTMIDEAVRFKVSSALKGKDTNTIAKAMLQDWFRYFAPPRTLRSDQEGGITSDQFSKVCDRYSTHRQLAGSDDHG